MGKVPPRLSPEQMMVTLLDEIAGRLEDLGSEGSLKSKIVTVGTTWHQEIGAWKTCHIYNGGPDDIYIRLDDMSTSPWVEGEAPLKINEDISIDLKARGYKPQAVEGPAGLRMLPLRMGSPVVCIICKTGTAEVRMFKLV